MADFFELDFLNTGTDRSGDAIAVRYQIGDQYRIHLIDGGFQDTSQIILDHLEKHYDKSEYIDYVSVTHNDGDHTGGLRKILEDKNVGQLWMIRPWLYSEQLLTRFKRFTSAEGLSKRLKEIYPNLAALEEIANRRGIRIMEPFQGSQIGAFHVLSPSTQHYFDLIVNSEQTPESYEDKDLSLGELLVKELGKIKKFMKGDWGFESFSPNETSHENEMSIVHYANLLDNKILLTGDAGRRSLMLAANFAETQGIQLPGLNIIQIPHHGSRRNVSSEVLDKWLGKKALFKPSDDAMNTFAVACCAEKDKLHPRKSVERAFMHRFAKVSTTEDDHYCIFKGVSARQGWGRGKDREYPAEYEL